jgi:hypothetical protein
VSFEVGVILVQNDMSQNQIHQTIVTVGFKRQIPFQSFSSNMKHGWTDERELCVHSLYAKST